MKKLVVLIIIGIALIQIFATEADTLKAQSRVYQLEGIRVVAESPTEAIGSLKNEVYTKEKQAEDVFIADAVENVTGVDIIDGGKGGSSISIRGFDEKQVKILLDGQPVNSGYFDEIDLYTLPIAEIKQIQILKGPVSSIYGANSMGGVINIITQNQENLPFLKAGIMFKRNNTNKLSLSSAKDFGNWDYELFLSRYHTNGKALSAEFEPTENENGYILNHSAKEQYDVQAKLNYSLFGIHSLGLQTGYSFFTKKEIPNSVYESRYRQFTDWKRFRISLLGSSYLSSNLNVDSNIYYDQYDDVYAEYADANYEHMYSIWPSFLENWTFGVFQKYSWQMGEQDKLIFGFRYEKEAYNRKDNGGYKIWTSNNQKTANVFNQFEHKFGKLSIALGAGFIGFKQKNREKGILNFQPSLGIYYKSKGNCKFSVAFSGNSKYPSLHQLFSNSSGNPDLLPEEALKYEVSYSTPFIFSDFTISIDQSVFYNDITNLIDKKNDKYQNIANLKSYGYDLEIYAKWLWEQKISYSYLNYENQKNAMYLQTPKNSVTLEENCILIEGFDLKINSVWKDNRDTLDPLENRIILPSYWIHSVFLHKKIANYSFTFGIKNILDRSYFYEYGFPAEGIDFIFNLETRFW